MKIPPIPVAVGIYEGPAVEVVGGPKTAGEWQVKRNAAVGVDWLGGAGDGIERPHTGVKLGIRRIQAIIYRVPFVSRDPMNDLGISLTDISLDVWHSVDVDNYPKGFAVIQLAARGWELDPTG